MPPLPSDEILQLAKDLATVLTRVDEQTKSHGSFARSTRKTLFGDDGGGGMMGRLHNYESNLNALVKRVRDLELGKAERRRDLRDWIILASASVVSAIIGGGLVAVLIQGIFG